LNVWPACNARLVQCIGSIPHDAYLSSNAWHHDKEGHEERRKDKVDSDGLSITDDRGPVRLRIQCWTAILAKKIKPATRHPLEGAKKERKIITLKGRKAVLHGCAKEAVELDFYPISVV
jgi:hypothetical protein